MIQPASPQIADDTIEIGYIVLEWSKKNAELKACLERDQFIINAVTMGILEPFKIKEKKLITEVLGLAGSLYVVGYYRGQQSEQLANLDIKGL